MVSRTPSVPTPFGPGTTTHIPGSRAKTTSTVATALLPSHRHPSHSVVGLPTVRRIASVFCPRSREQSVSIRLSHKRVSVVLQCFSITTYSL